MSAVHAVFDPIAASPRATLATLLTTEQFDDALQKGLGRAIIALREGCDDERAQTLLGHCLRWRGSDYFVEGGRGAYLREAIALSGREMWFVEQIAREIRAIPSEDGQAHVNHLFQLGRELAQTGNASLTEAMFARAATLDLNTDYDAVLTVLNMDEERALPILAATMGRAATRGAWASITDLVRDCRERDGRTRALLRIVREASRRDPDVRAYRIACAQGRRALDADNTDDSDVLLESPFEATPATLEALEHAITSADSFDISWICKHWARAANEAELRRAAVEIERNTDPARTSRLLCVFLRDAPYPLGLGPLAPLLDSSAEAVAYTAAAVVARSDKPNARELAFGLLERGSNARGALRILSRHAQEGDVSRLLAAFTQRGAASVEAALNHDVFDVVERDVGNVDAPRLLRWAYEHTTCPHCRFSFVDMLVRLNAAPKEMLDECLHDSYEETRALARGTMTHSNRC